MRSTKPLIVLILLAVFTQNIECNNADSETNPFPLATRERDLRGLRDVWDQVKSSAISSWNFLKKVAEDTRSKISMWTTSAREYAVKLEKSFEEQLQDLQTKFKDIITNLLGTGKLTQECLKNEGTNIKDALKEILKKMTECVSNQIKQLTNMKEMHAKLSGNDTLFTTDLENKLEACKADRAHYEECLYTVRESVYDELEELDNHIQRTNMESRSLADDIRNTLIACSIENLADASSHVTTEMMEVVRCVLDGKGINKAMLE